MNVGPARPVNDGALTEFGRAAAMNGTRGTGYGTGSLELKRTADLRSAFKGALDEHLRIGAKPVATRICPDSAGARPLQGLMRA